MKLSLFSTIVFCCCSLTAFSQWNANNTPVSVPINHQREVRGATDTQGGAYLVWVDYRIDPQVGDVYAQRLNAAGVPQWTTNGIGICTDQTDQGAASLVEDGNGGAIITWSDWRNGNRDIYAQKVDASGTVAWAANGTPIVVKPSDQQDAKGISDGAGGAIIVWQDSAAAGFDVYAQRISSSGTAMWTTGGVAICNAVNDQINPRLESDGAGGAIITWQDKRDGISYDIRAQRVDANGAVQWANNGIVICNALGTQSNPKIEPDGMGGAYIGWQDKRNLNYDIYAQRVNGAGIVLWTANGVAVSTNSASQSAVDMTAKGGIDGAILVWKDDRNGNSDIYAQRVNPSGVPQWTANGLVIANASGPELKPDITEDGFGNAIIVWQDSTAGDWDIVTSKRDGNGTNLWTVTICNALEHQTDAKNVPDGSGGCIYAWQDRRSGQDYDIYAHHLFSDGSLLLANAEPTPQGKLSVSPNPFSNAATLSYSSMLDGNTLYITNAMGQTVRKMEQLSGNTVTLQRAGLAPGIYHVRLTSGNTVVANAKLTIVD